MIQQVETLKSKMKTQWGNLRTNADENLQNAKSKLKRSQTLGVSTLVKTQIETDKWLRKTAFQFNSPKTTTIQDKIIGFSNYWMPLRIDNYDSLNAKKASKQIRDLRLTELLRIRYHEEENKNRKTVLKAIDDRIKMHNSGAIS
jgi:outer membrane lipoprotein-sorting protein